MAITLNCQCGRKLQVGDEYAGRRAKCPECGAVMPVPAASPAVAVAAAEAHPARAESAHEPPPPPAWALERRSSAPAASPAAVAIRPAAPPAYAPPPGGVVNVKPLVVRNDTNVISKLEVVRDQIFDYFEQVCKSQMVDGLVLKSPPFSPSVWVIFECWTPHPQTYELTERSTAKLTLRPKEFHRFEYEIDVDLQDGGKLRKFFNIVDFQPVHAEAIVCYLLRRTTYRLKQHHFRRCRLAPIQLWLPKNKIVRLRKDLMGIVIRVLAVLGLLSLPLAGLGLVLWGVAIALYVWNRFFRRSYIISSGKPPREPRLLVRMDSWQTILYDLGGQAAAFKQELLHDLQAAQRDGFIVSDERIWHWGVDGAEERTQMVVTFRRGIGFVHVYQYGSDLYVGWDAHVNAGTWDEVALGSGIDPATDEFSKLHTIQAGWHVPNEYDITDTNCLIEWIHGAVTKVVKRTLEEHKIDQEIDFKIIRSERDGVLGRENPEGMKGRVKSIFSRAKVKREA